MGFIHIICLKHSVTLILEWLKDFEKDDVLIGGKGTTEKMGRCFIEYVYRNGIPDALHEYLRRNSEVLDYYVSPIRS